MHHANKPSILTTTLGYQKLDNQSEKALKFLKWYANKMGVEIQTSESENGEYRIFDGERTFRVDGFIPKNIAGTDKDIVVEYLGCAYHGSSIFYALKNMMRLRA